MIITIGRKPFVGAVVDTIKDVHCGAINVDASRIKFVLSSFADAAPRGRFPANLILEHTQRCVQIGTKKIKVPKHRNPSTINSIFCHTDEKKKYQPDRAFSDFSDEDGCETVANWRCVEGCPIAKLETQSGVSRYFKVIQ